jgi:tRNA threonylcarbamoyladenosine biosynthesis protein TsaB
MITLALDTSTPTGSVAVLAFRELAYEETFTADRSHSSSLFSALERARSCFSRLDQIVVGLGPGSYAGIRIGISAGLGLSLALGARLVGIPSVASLDVKPTGYLVIGDARRSAFYLTHVDHGVCQEGPTLTNEAGVRSEIQYKMLPVFTTEPVGVFPSAVVAHPSARLLALLADAGRGIVQTDNLEPIYLREPHITQPKRLDAPPPGSAATLRGT